MKPILLLDVDGVLCIIDSTCDARKIMVRQGQRECPYYPNRDAERLLRTAWERFDVRWLTAWGEFANAIAAHHGLEKRPVISDDGREDWKASGAAHDLADVKVPVAWIEDGITPKGRDLVHSRGWFYLHCEPFVGATPAHIELLEEFAARFSAGTDCPEFGRWIRDKQGGPHGEKYRNPPDRDVDVRPLR